MNWTWDYAANYVEVVYGGYVNWDEEFFNCPECGEPIYKSDWDEHEPWQLCPVCEFSFDAELEVKESDDMDCPDQKETGDE